MIRLFCVTSVVVLLIAAQWLACHNRVRNFVHRHRRFILHTLGYERRVLDFGSGSGCSTAFLARAPYFATVTRVDVRNAGTCAGPDVLVAGHGPLPFRDREFDVGICAFVLHHTPDLTHSLRELRRCCRCIVLMEDTPTPRCRSDARLVRRHATSDWGTGSFHTVAEWENSVFPACGLRVHTREVFSRWVCPFAKQPLWYPVPRTAWILTGSDCR